MQIIEIKNNLLRIGFDASQENLVLSDFLIVKDALKSFIAQIIYLEGSDKGTFALAKLLFTFDNEGVVTDYNGTIPDIKTSSLVPVSTEEFLYLLPAKIKVLLGEIAQQKTELVLDKTMFDQRVLVCSEKRENSVELAKNNNAQITSKGGKVVIFDTKGDVDLDKKITACVDFKLPLNYNSIDFIYKKGLDNATAESKAVIQDVFFEVQNYVKTLPEGFLPFETFKTVVDEQYKELGIVQLVLLKNKLLKYKEEGIFAQNKEEINSLKESLTQNSTTVINISNLDDVFQREFIFYVLSVIEEMDDTFYVMYDINNENSDKKLLKQIYSSKKSHPIINCAYSYKYLKELKQLSQNVFLFAPIQQQSDFASYNVMLHKLNSQEFIVYGKITHHVPLIVKLSALPQEKFIGEEESSESETPNIEQTVEETEFQQVQQEKLNPMDEFQNEGFEIDETPTTQDEIEIYPQKEVPQAEEEILPQEDFVPNEEIQANPPFENNTIDEETDAQIVKDVDEIYSHPKSEDFDFDEEFPTNTDGEFTEEDLDFIQELSQDGDSVEDTEDFSTEVLPDEQEEQIVPETVSQEEFPQDFVEQEQTIDSDMVQEQELPDFDTNAQADFENIDQSQNIFSPETQTMPSSAEDDIIPIADSAGPILPVYNAEIPQKNELSADDFEKGDKVTHPKYGNGVIEKMIKYGNKTLCSINFDNIGRRLLDPSLAEIKKIA